MCRYCSYNGYHMDCNCECDKKYFTFNYHCRKCNHTMSGDYFYNKISHIEVKK